MAFASLIVNAANVSLTLPYSPSLTLAQSVQMTLAPKQADNSTAFDLTAMTSAEIKMDNGQSGSALIVNTTANTLVSHGSTGCVISISQANALGAIGTLIAGGASGGRISISATDGTSTVLIGLGRWQLQSFA